MRLVPSLEPLRMELEQELLLLIYVHGSSEAFWKGETLWTAKTGGLKA